MTKNEEFVRAAYRTAEGSVLDLADWRDSFTEDGVFNRIDAGEVYEGERLSVVVETMGRVLPDLHRELLRINDMGDMVAVELLIQGTFLGPMPTPAGLLPPTGARVNVPTADFLYLRDGRIQTFNCYVSRNIMLAQMGVLPDFAAAIKASAA
jgi:ketosteroid isomerase-like protein